MTNWAGIAQAASSAYSASEGGSGSGGSGGGGGGGYGTNTNLKDMNMGGHSIVNIAPPGSNAGEIMKQFIGASVNGGFGAPESRYGPGSEPGRGETFDPDQVEAVSMPRDPGDGSSIPWGLMAAGVLGIGGAVWLFNR